MHVFGLLWVGQVSAWPRRSYSYAGTIKIKYHWRVIKIRVQEVCLNEDNGVFGD